MKFNYKKSLLSVAAATALGFSSLNAGYIPLTDNGAGEEQWTLFGVTGLKASGAGAGTSAGTFSISNTTANAVTDATLDELYVEGFIASTGQSLGKVKVLSPYSTIEVRIDTTGAVFNKTEPVRTMYVAMSEGGAPAFAITYRASLEGETMQYSTSADGSDAYTITINANNTYNNPGVGSIIQEIAGLPGSTLSKLKDIVDYDFTDNPINYAYYDKDTQQTDAVAGEYLRVYSYDTATETWKLYDSRNAADANDFTELEKGKAYWAKMNNPANTVGGLVLGSSSISAAEYTAAGVVDGWNLIAFDNENPDIRKSETGLLVTIDADNDIKIYDASGNHAVSINISDHTDKIGTVNEINNAIKLAILHGKMPKTFDLRVIPTEAADQYAFLSTKRFILEDSTGAVKAVTTLAGKHPYSLNVSDLATTDDSTDITDLGVAPAGFNAAMSKYGEYTLLVEPLVGDADDAAPWDTAASIDDSGPNNVVSARVHIQSAATDATTITAKDMPSDNGDDVSDVATALNNSAIDGAGIYTVTATAVDSNLDATANLVLLSSTEPFYVRDHTFTRVFDYTDVDNATGKITITGTGTDATFIDPNDGSDDNAAAADAGMLAGLEASKAYTTVVGATEKLAFITAADDANEFIVTENTSSTVVFDTLKDTTTDDNLAKGAIKGVYSLTSFASAELINTLASGDAASNLDAVDDGLDTVLVEVVTPHKTYTEASATAITGAAGAVTVTEFTTFVKSQIEAWLNTNSIQYNSVTVTDADPAVVTIVSTEITDFTITATDVSAGTNDTGIPLAASSVTGKLETVSPDLAEDLKFNAVYTPNYVIDGPLYTMKEAGFTLKALVTGTTDLSDGSVNWDSVDLTRTPSDWLDSQDYNLFEINENSGYWSFLEASSGTNAITISKAEIKPLSYTHRFNENGTNYNSVSGNIALTVDGLETDTRAVPVVSATISGSVVELVNSAGSNIYSGKLSSYEIENIKRGYSYEVLANVADGLGYNLKSANVGLTIDFEKPATPTIALGDGTSVAFTSTSSDVAGYSIYNGQIPEESTTTASNLLVNLTAAEASAYGLCQNTDKLAWDDVSYNLNVIAIDGAGTLGKGNVSDTKTQIYVPMLKDAVRVVSSNLGEFVNVGTIYDAQCANGGAQTVNYGMGITTETDLYTAKLAYKPENVTDTTATPITLYVYTLEGLNKIVASIQYAPIYAGKSVYVEVNSKVYALVLPTEDEINGDDKAATPIDADPYYGDAGVGADSTNPLLLDDGIDDTPAGTQNGYAELQTDQSL